MEAQRNRSAVSMLDNLKDRLGFSGKRASYDDHDEEFYDDFEQPYDEQGDQDYGEYGYDDRNDYRGSGHGDSGHPPLVSLNDVRASTQIPDHLNRDPLASQQTASVRPVNTDYEFGGQNRSFSGRRVERAADYMRSEPGSDSVNSPRRSEGIDSLFSSTTPAYDPYEAYAGAGNASHSPTRGMSVMKPVSYGDVERVAKVLKAGDVVVLSMRNTPDHLAKRILDFSFGVASALDASVECVGEKVFVILRGSALSEQEKLDLRNQGVL